ncbi:MAG: hypothetical protein PHW41_05725 [Eubacteriales bacterium]|nr:hypothetical protein [Eubacteriales bacterium]
MSEYIERNEEGIDSLRNRMDADARFRRSLSGYDPQDVRAYVENVKRIFAQQTRAAKQEQEDLLAQLDSAKSEVQARNCGIKKLKDLLVEREAQLNTANMRINTLLQTVKTHGAERDELERLRQEAASSGNTERILSLEKETQQLRAAVAQASNLVNTWKAERERLMEENDRLREEVNYLRAVSSRATADYEASRAYTANQQYQPAYDQTIRPTHADVIAAENRFMAQSAQQPMQQPMQQQAQPNYQQPVQPVYQQPVQQPMQQPVQQPMQQPMQPTAQQPAMNQQKEFSQVADKLATMFAEAYQLISQFKSGLDAQPEPQQQQRPAQPAMQILRPEAVNAENFYPRR